MNMFNKILTPFTMWVQPNYFWGAVAGAAISAFGASSSAKKAASASSGASKKQIALIREQLAKSEADLKPYTEAGGRGLAEYERLLGAQGDYESLVKSDVQQPFQFGAAEFDQYKDPGYDFRLQEGERALNRGFAGLGKRFSGERAAGLISYGQQMGSQEFGAARGRAMQDYESGVSREQQAYERSLGTYGRQYTGQVAGYGALADSGRQAVTSLAGIRASAASGAGQAISEAGQAQAAGILGQAGAWSGAIRDIGQQFTGTGNSTYSLPDYSSSYSSPYRGTIDTGGGFSANLPFTE